MHSSKNYVYLVVCAGKIQQITSGLNSARIYAKKRKDYTIILKAEAVPIDPENPNIENE